MFPDDLPPGVAPTPGSKIETPNVKKRHKRAKSSAKNLDNSQEAGEIHPSKMLNANLPQFFFR
jgi:hypothetical protein